MKYFVLIFFLVLTAGIVQVFGSSQAYFSPGDNVRKRLTDRIDSSFESIDIMCYSFTSRSLAKSLLRAHGRRVAVRILLDASQTKEKYSLYSFFKKNGMNVKRVSGLGKGIMHNKVAIFDTKSIVTGSYNWTGSAELLNYENIVFSDDDQLIFEFSQQFNKLWNKGE